MKTKQDRLIEKAEATARRLEQKAAQDRAKYGPYGK